MTMLLNLLEHALVTMPLSKFKADSIYSNTSVTLIEHAGGVASYIAVKTKQTKIGIQAMKSAETRDGTIIVTA